MSEDPEPRRADPGAPETRYSGGGSDGFFAPGLDESGTILACCTVIGCDYNIRVQFWRVSDPPICPTHRVVLKPCSEEHQDANDQGDK
jgi:hypothetical protein